MTDDIVARLRDNAENGWIDRDNARKAADEIERLRAELAAEREKSRNAEKAWECALQERNEMQAERDAYSDNADKMNAAASRYLRRAEQAEKERDALRSELSNSRTALYETAREYKDALIDFCGYTKEEAADEFWYCAAMAALSCIDAALKGDGG